MTKFFSQSTIDLSPWPLGQGFRGGDLWWDYVLSQKQRARIDFLILAAMLDDKVCDLLLQHDQALFNRFALSPEVSSLLSSIEAVTLESFAEEMLFLFEIHPDINWNL